MASLTVEASWTDAESGEKISVNGMTENLGRERARSSIWKFCRRSEAKFSLRIFDEEKTIIEVPTQVIRVERDPSKPLAALSIVENLKKWKQNALTAAENWVTRHWQLNYEEEWVN
ncbi:MAG: hypothetical protein WKF71_11805 [Pyrinomonadaceae bacterium]